MNFTLNGTIFSVEEHILGWMFTVWRKNGRCLTEGNFHLEAWQAMKEAIEYAKSLDSKASIEDEKAEIEHIQYYGNPRSLN